MWKNRSKKKENNPINPNKSDLEAVLISFDKSVKHDLDECNLYHSFCGFSKEFVIEMVSLLKFSSHEKERSTIQRLGST